MTAWARFTRAGSGFTDTRLRVQPIAIRAYQVGDPGTVMLYLDATSFPVIIEGTFESVVAELDRAEAEDITHQTELAAALMAGMSPGDEAHP